MRKVNVSLTLLGINAKNSASQTVDFGILKLRDLSSIWCRTSAVQDPPQARRCNRLGLLRGEMCFPGCRYEHLACLFDRPPTVNSGPANTSCCNVKRSPTIRPHL